MAGIKFQNSKKKKKKKKKKEVFSTTKEHTPCEVIGFCPYVKEGDDYVDCEFWCNDTDEERSLGKLNEKVHS